MVKKFKNMINDTYCVFFVVITHRPFQIFRLKVTMNEVMSSFISFIMFSNMFLNIFIMVIKIYLFFFYSSTKGNFGII